MGRTIASAVAMAVWAWPSWAAACGGFFCSPATTPIVQTAETIAFAVEEDGSVTTTVQIQYEGTAEDFAWILPVATVPEVKLGTSALFAALDPATRPRIRTVTATEGSCATAPHCTEWGGPISLDAGRRVVDAGVRVPPPVTVDSARFVGPYEAVVLSADDAAALHSWLAEHGYDLPETAVPILADYVAEGSHFVALRLRSGRTVGEIQPIVLHYQEPQPCLPIRLTAIATLSDLPILVYVLGAARATPYNYLSITPELDDLAFWQGDTRRYDSLVARAVLDAGGQAFVTQFAGTPPSITLELETIREQVDAAGGVDELIAVLRGNELFDEPEVRALVERLISPPSDLKNPSVFYDCLARWDCSAFDDYLERLYPLLAALKAELDELFFAPRRDAQAMVARHPWLTRMYTSLNVAEMTVDPVFVLDSDLGEVSNTLTATRVTECSPEYYLENAPVSLELPSGTRIPVSEGTKVDAQEYCESTGRELANDCGGCSAAGGSEIGGIALVLAILGRRKMRGRRR